jgi:monoamine oxidase
MYTARDMFPNGQVAELGGELIDSGHLTMHALAQELQIALDDREAGMEGITAEVWWVEGKAIPEATILEQFRQVAPRMAELEMMADEDDATFERLDNTSMASWLDENLQDAPELKSVLTSAYRGEYGRELEEQSVLNLLYLIGSDELDEFRIFGASDERYHTHAGSDTFPQELAKRLQPGQIVLEHKLVRAARRGAGYTLTFEDAAGGLRDIEADLVVFALPFSVLRDVDLSALELSDEKQRVISELNYGTNAKLMGAFNTRVWREQHASSGSVTSDEPFQQCWDTSIGQAGTSGLLTNFLGGRQGEQSGEGDPESVYTSLTLPGVEKIFPGALNEYVANSAVRMHWPSSPHTRGSYACYAPGQWAFYGTEGLPEHEGALQFCGEHTSLDNQGYMEGAAETGALVAGALLERLGVQPSDGHAALLALKRALPQPAFGEIVSPRSYLRRMRAVRQTLRELSMSP